MRKLRRDWHERAECLGKDTDAYYVSAATDVSHLRDGCAPCKVRYECLAHALNLPENEGFWGGMSESERRALRRPYKKTPPDWHQVIEAVLNDYGVVPVNETRTVVESMAARVVHMANMASKSAS